MPAASSRRPWSPDELVLALDLYCRTPFGRLHQRNPDIVALSGALGRTPGSVAMKACNFASLDPAERARGVRGLSRASAADAEVFAAYSRDVAALVEARDAAAARLWLGAVEEGEEQEQRAHPLPLPPGGGPTEIARVVKVRRVQRAFRQVVVSGYDYACAVCALSVERLIEAAHLIPWSWEGAGSGEPSTPDRSGERSHLLSHRADPCNGLAVCPLHHAALDAGLITVSETLTVVTSKRLRIKDPPPVHRVALLEVEGAPLRMPARFPPAAEALEFHRRNVFVN